jgi:hypothetical protein
MRVGKIKKIFIISLRLYPLLLGLLLLTGYLLGGFSDQENPIVAKNTFYAILTILSVVAPLGAMLAFFLIGRASDRAYLRNTTNQENFTFEDPFVLPDEQMHGYKLAKIVGREPTFMGLTGDLYTADASAHCGVDSDHVPPVKDCQCGFHAFKELNEAVFERSIYRSAFLFDVDLYGLGFIYQRGYRAETQVINHMIAPKRCMLCKTLPIKGFVAKYEFSSLGPDMWQWQLRCSLCSSATKEENKLSLDEMAKKLKIQII